MTNCDDLLDQLTRQTRRHVQVALMAEAPPVAAMHIDLALNKHRLSSNYAMTANARTRSLAAGSPSLGLTADRRRWIASLAVQDCGLSLSPRDATMRSNRRREA